MPIQFRCTSCNQKLAISRRKAGKVVKCPACAEDLSVPTLEEAAATGMLVDSPKPVQKTTPSPQPAREPSPPVEPPPEEPPVEEPLFDEVAPGVFDDLDEPDNDPQPPELDDVADAGALPQGNEPVSPESQIATAASAPAPRRWSAEEEDEEEGFHLGRRATDDSGLDMTPMVDVTFLLLIFFMITASFSVQKSMEAEAPEPDDEGAAQMPSMDDLASDSVIVEIDENDAIFVDDAQIGSISELAAALEQKMSSEDKREMLIEAHPLAKHGTVVQVTDAGIEAKMQRIRRVSRKGSGE